MTPPTSVKRALIRASGTLSAAPFPIQDFRHVFIVAADPVAMLDQFLIELLDDVAGDRAHSGHSAQRLHRQVIPAELVDDRHVEWRGGGALLDISSHVEARGL